MLLRVATERSRGVERMFQPLMSSLNKENRPKNQKATSLTNAIKKLLEGVSAVAFLAAAYPKVDETIVEGEIDVWLGSPDGAELKEKGSMLRFDSQSDAALHFNCHHGIIGDALDKKVADKSKWHGKIGARKVDRNDPKILMDPRVVRGPTPEKSKGGGSIKASDLLAAEVAQAKKDDAARLKFYAEADEREHREAGLWGDSLFGGGTGMHHQPPRPELPTDDDELRALLARLFPLPRYAEPPDLSDSDSDDD